MSPRVLVVGGYFDQINSLLEASISVMALLPVGRHKEMVPRKRVKTQFTNVISLESCLEIAVREHSKEPFSAVVSHYELSIPVAAGIATELGIPGPDQEASNLIRNKRLTRDIANVCSDIQSHFSLISDKEQALAFFQKHGKAVIKPSAGVGGRDIRLIESEIDIDAYLNGIDLSQEPFQMEQFIEGTEFSVDGFMDNRIERSGHQIVSVTAKAQPKPPAFVETVHVQANAVNSTVTQEHRLRINKILNDFYHRLGYCLGATHTEFILTENNELYLLEGHLRTGGFSMWEMTRFTTGVDLFLHHTKCILGIESAIHIQQRNQSAVVAGLECQPGTVHNVTFQPVPKENLPIPLEILPCPSFDIGDEIGCIHPSRYVRYGGHMLCLYTNTENTLVEDLIAQSEHIASQFKYEY